MAVTQPHDDSELIESLVQALSARGLVAPAVVALETLRPLGYLASQAYLLLEPLLPVPDGRRYAALLEDPQRVKALLDALERHSRPSAA